MVMCKMNIVTLELWLMYANKQHFVKGLRPGNSDLMVEEFTALRQVDTNIEMVWRQQTMKDLHVKYPKQRGLHIILSSEGWRKIVSLLWISSLNHCQGRDWPTCQSGKWHEHHSHRHKHSHTCKNMCDLKDTATHNYHRWQILIEHGGAFISTSTFIKGLFLTTCINCSDQPQLKVFFSIQWCVPALRTDKPYTHLHTQTIESNTAQVVQNNLGSRPQHICILVLSTQ